MTHLVSGGKDRAVRVWNSTLQAVGMLEVGPALSLRDGSVASIDVRPPDAGGELVLLIGTYGGEIIEFGGGGGRGGVDLVNARAEVLVHSHSGGELWGLAVHPTMPDLYVTVGDDCTLRVWSVGTDRMVHSVALGWPARSVCFHPLGSVLAVGFMEGQKGGGKKEKKGPEHDGKGGHDWGVSLYSFHFNSNNSNNFNSNFNNSSSYTQISMEKLSIGCITTAWVNDIKFSPNGRILAVGSHDKKMYFYDIPVLPSGEIYGSEWGSCLKKTKFIFDKHSSAVLHFDFSTDGKYLQTDSQVRNRTLRYGACLCVISVCCMI